MSGWRYAGRLDSIDPPDYRPANIRDNHLNAAIASLKYLKRVYSGDSPAKAPAESSAQ